MPKPDLVAEVQERHYELSGAPGKCACSQPWPCHSIEKELADEVERLRMALEFYADKENWKQKRKPNEHWEYMPAQKDGGDTARAALEGADSATIDESLSDA